MTEPINLTGPRCAWCGCRPDDPLWVKAGDAKDLACFGCLADMRAKGETPRVLGRAIFNRASDSAS